MTADALHAVVREYLRDADDDTVEIVCAIAGLVGCVAYADRDVSAEEVAHLGEELGRIRGLSDGGVRAIVDATKRHVADISQTRLQRYTRTLRDLGDRDLRCEVLDVLVDSAAADGVITADEVNVLRRATSGLGLTQDDYNRAQARHRDKLAALKGS